MTSRIPIGQNWVYADEFAKQIMEIDVSEPIIWRPKRQFYLIKAAIFVRIAVPPLPKITF